MSSFSKSLPLAVAAAAAITASSAQADDASDIARVKNLPPALVQSVLTNVDAFFASTNAPANHMVSGIVKDLTLKAVKDRMSNLDDATPGKSSDATFEDKNASYAASVRTSRHDTSETKDCVENKVTLTSTEGQPYVKDGAFGFDTVHPRIATWTWMVSFCRTATGSGSYSEWQLATPAK